MCHRNLVRKQILVIPLFFFSLYLFFLNIYTFLLSLSLFHFPFVSSLPSGNLSFFTFYYFVILPLQFNAHFGLISIKMRLRYRLITHERIFKVS